MSNAAASSAIAFSGFPAWVFLHSFASFGERRNRTTASCLTSAKRPVEVSFELADPPGISRWFVHCAGLKKKRGFNGPPYILNASGAFIVMRMQFFRGGFDYFVYRAGPGKPSLDLIPWPWPTGGLHKRVGILPSSDGTSYYVVFLVSRFKPRIVYEIPVFSSENQSWSTKVASISVDLDTTSYQLIMHDPSKAIAVGWSSMAWIDLWRGVLLCDRLDQDAPVLRLINWPVPSCGSLLCGSKSGCFVERWSNQRSYSSKEWDKCFKVDISSILATHLSSSDLLRKMWDDKLNKLDLNKLSSAPPTLSLTDEAVVYFMANLVSDEALLLLVNVSDEKL
ncbi:hypothetical protein HU200_052549 [Digitaria exilis]|uniref:DUF1618 domain-containing protein n=1 Tax=Digitaria exilis TaxID=1010633 RepID=A0A835ANF6_9POAL|nr:hypothetical protein HU200_052549 [Digitaria exilis]